MWGGKPTVRGFGQLWVVTSENSREQTSASVGIRSTEGVWIAFTICGFLVFRRTTGQIWFHSSAFARIYTNLLAFFSPSKHSSTGASPRILGDLGDLDLWHDMTIMTIMTRPPFGSRQRRTMPDQLNGVCSPAMDPSSAAVPCFGHPFAPKGQASVLWTWIWGWFKHGVPWTSMDLDNFSMFSLNYSVSLAHFRGAKVDPTPFVCSLCHFVMIKLLDQHGGHGSRWSRHQGHKRIVKLVELLRVMTQLWINTSMQTALVHLLILCIIKSYILYIIYMSLVLDTIKYSSEEKASAATICMFFTGQRPKPLIYVY